MSSKPVIGLPADRRLVDPHPFHMAGEKYVQAIVDGSDGLPFIIPALGDPLDVGEIIAHVDGILLTGSPSNIEPYHYEGQPSEPGTLHDPHRDALTLPLARRAMAEGVPVLAICRGFQELNVALGGTLHQKVHELPGHRMHKENPQDPLDIQYGPSHEIRLVPGGILHKLAGSDTVKVNSLHSQGVARLAEGVTVEAVADDGLIEAFVVDSVPGFALSVQWHPEWQVRLNDFSTAIFRTFGEACRAYAAKRKVNGE